MIKLNWVMCMKNRMDIKGIIILIVIFISFYFISTIVLDKYKHDEEISDNTPAIKEEDLSYTNEKDIVLKLYQDVRMLYDVVNVKYKVSQEDVIIIDNITYKKITNFDEVVSGLFTNNGISKYISDLGEYFAYTNDAYYLAGNLVSYQTYYFRGDSTKIYVTDVYDNEINAIIYEKWTSGNKNTLATIKIVKENDRWLIDNISILADE